MKNKFLKNSIAICFFLSGFAGLVYEIVWSRQLALVFGAAAPSIGIVLASFMFGLGLGSIIIGKWADSVKNPLKTYALIEGIIGIYALCFSSLLDVQFTIYSHLTFATQSFIYPVKAILIFLLILFPTFLMGGTLPLISKFMIRQRSEVLTGIGFLYSINTAGAVIGAFMTGYIFLAFLGMRWTIYLAVLINFFVMIITLIITRWYSFPQQNVIPQKLERPEADHNRQSHNQFFFLIILLLYGLSGFTSLAYEVCWSRFFSLILGNTSYALTTVLVSFLTGIALGSWLASRFGSTETKREVVFFRLHIIIAFSSLLLHYFIVFIPSLIGGLFKAYGISFWLLQLMQLALITLFLNIPAICFGFLFPIVSDIAISRISSLGRHLGTIYLSNTIGATLGSLIASFILIPAIGLDNCLNILVFTNLIIAGLSIFIIRYTENSILKFLCSSLLTIIVVTTFIYTFPQKAVHSILTDRIPLKWKVEKLYEDKEATVAVISRKKQKGTIKRLYINGNPSASSLRGPLQTERLESLLPLLLHNNPRNVLVIGLGTGITAGAASVFPLETIESVEIISRISDAAKAFRDVNQNILENNRFKLWLEDGRQYLKRTKNYYDVITTGPQHPTQAGSVHLFTHEYFEECNRRLRHDGIMAQWIPLYQFYTDDIIKILRTMNDVFPVLSIWYINQDLVLLGRKDNYPTDFNRYSQTFHLTNVRDLLNETGIKSAEDLLSLFICSEKSFTFSGKDEKYVTDDFPSIEFSSLSAVNKDTIPENLVFVLSLLEKPETNIKGFLSWDKLDSDTKNSIQKRLEQRSLYYLGQISLHTKNYNIASRRFMNILVDFPDWPNLKDTLNQAMMKIMEGKKKKKKQH